MHRLADASVDAKGPGTSSKDGSRTKVRLILPARAQAFSLAALVAVVVLLLLTLGFSRGEHTRYPLFDLSGESANSSQAAAAASEDTVKLPSGDTAKLHIENTVKLPSEDTERLSSDYEREQHVATPTLNASNVLDRERAVSARCWGPADAPLVITSVFAFEGPYRALGEDVVTCQRANRVAYASRHGLKYCEYTESLVANSSKPAKWSKYIAALRLLDVAPWVVYMDADCFFLDFNRSLLEEVANVNADADADTHKDVDAVWTSDYVDGKINSGVFFVRNTSWSRSFLLGVATGPFHPYDQAALLDYAARNSSDFERHSKTLAHREVQTVPWHPYKWWRENQTRAREVSRGPVPFKEASDNTFIAHHTYGYSQQVEGKYESLKNYLGCW